MKSLLVDTLRAANDSDDDLTPDETLVPEVTVSPPAESAVVPEIEAELELLENVADAAERDAANSDAQFPGEAPILEASVFVAPVATNCNRAAVFERAAVWMPVVCMMLIAVSAAAFSGWSNVTGMSQNPDLDVLSGQGYTPELRDRIANGQRASGFALMDPRHAPDVSTQRAVPAVNNRRDANPASSDIVIARSTKAPRAIAGMTAIDDATFTSLAATYQAFISGQISNSALDRLLMNRALVGGAATELELKLLLQRYPHAAQLHNALGTLLANSSRWPEARVAFERAGELSESASGGELQ